MQSLKVSKVLIACGIVMLVVSCCHAQSTSTEEDGEGDEDEQTSSERGNNENYEAPEGQSQGEDRDLASALGVDRQALYEELLRMQQEMGNSPPSPPELELPELPESPEFV